MNQELETILKTNNISQIAYFIEKDWGNVSDYAFPYLNAMKVLTTIQDSYILDSGSSIVNYFLANANCYRTPNAKHIKSHLKKIVKESY